MRSIFRLLAVAALLASPGALATNAVSSVVYKDGTVEIAAESPPNFTTFTMANPVRLVIDLSDCVLMKVPAEIAVDQGAVKTIKAAAFGDGSSAVARVTIEFSSEVETQIASRGNSLLVKISSAPAVASAEKAAPAPASADAEPSDTAPPKPLPPPPPVAETPAPPPAAPVAPAAVAAATPPPPAPEPVPAAAPPPPEPAPVPPPEPPPPAKPTIAEAIPAFPAAPPPAPPPPAEPPPPPAAVAAAPPPPPEPTPAPPPEPPPPAKPTIAEVIPTPSTPPPATPPAAAEAQPPPPAPAEPAPMQAPVQVSNRRKRLALVGFRPGSGAKATQVFIRTNEPVHYTVSENGTSLTVVVENTRVMRRNDLRPLDARFFATPVDSIAARQVKHDVIVEIRLKATAPYRAVQNGDEVQIDFEPARAAERALPPQENTAG